MGAAASRTVQDALRHAAARSDALRVGKKLVVAFSGGQDSTCLLHALTELGTETGMEVVAAHVDHCLRSGSAEDAARAIDAARALGVRGVLRRADVSAYRALQKRCSIEQAARAARYQILAQVAADEKADAVAVAHTADDQAETVLLNLVRGTGLAGLAGMRLDDVLDPARLGPPLPEAVDSMGGLAPRVRVVRPLLRVERRVTAAYCRELGLPVIEDVSNLSRAHTRNRVRLDILPGLEDLNPSVRSALARMADLVAEDVDALDQMARAQHARLARRAGARALKYDLAGWREQPRALQRQLLRLGIEALTGGLENVPSAPIEDALDLVQTGGRGRSYHLPRETELTISDDGLILQRRGPRLDSGPILRATGKASV